MSTENVVAHTLATAPLASRKRISDATLDAVRAVPLVNVVGAVVSLRRVGHRLVGLCPFHGERTASFGIDPQKNLWYCHGCHKGGDVVAFIELFERCDFRKAVEILAARAGISVEHGVIDHAKLTAEAQRLGREKRNRQLLHRQQVRAGIELDRLRQIERTCSLESMPADLFARLRRADVRYVLLNFLSEATAIEFLRLSPADQLDRIDQAMLDGVVVGDGGAVWEVPLQ